MGARAMVAVATVLLLLGAVCAASVTTTTVRVAASPASQEPVSLGGGAGDRDGSGRGGADGELFTDEAVRVGNPARRRSGTGVPEVPGRGCPAHGATDTAALAGTRQGPRPAGPPKPGRGAPAAQRIAQLQVFRR